MKPNPQPLVHLDVERALEMIGDPATVLKIVAMAQEALRRDIPRLTQLLAADDIASMAAILHTLKGMLPIFCADALVQQVTACERAAKTARTAADLSAYPEVGARLQELLAEIDAYLARMGPAAVK